jgi:outer membrane protein TolC
VKSLARLTASTLASLSLLAAVANAQTPPSPGPSAAASSAAPPQEAPPPPTVSDPLLEPVPPAAKIVSGWQDALALVRTRSTDLRIAVEGLARAQAQTRVALGAALPTLTGTANVTDPLVRTVPTVNGATTIQTFPPHAISYGAGATLSIPLFAPRAWYGIGTGEKAEHVTELNIQNQKRLLAAAAASALVSVITSERVAEINRSGLRAALERLLLTKRRAALGAATALDVLRVEQDAAQARGAIVSGDENLRQARESLGMALGFPEPWGVPQGLDLDSFARDSERACPRAGSVEDRPDVAAAREQIGVERRQLRDVELSFAPTVNLVTTYSVNVTPATFAVDQTNTLHTWTIAGVLNWTIFDGGARYGLLRDNRAQIEQQIATTEAARRQATMEVIQTARSVQVAEQARQVAEKTRDLARETDRLTRVSFGLGRGTSLELVDAGRQLRDAESTLALREFDVVQAKIRALLALSLCEYLASDAQTMENCRENETFSRPFGWM